MRARVLVVDDDEAARAVVAQLLRADGCDVEVASDGRQALERLQQGAIPEILLVDLMMPDVTGWALLDALAAMPDLAKLPVVVMTSFDEVVGLPPGCPVLHKPVDADVLLERVHAALA